MKGMCENMLTCKDLFDSIVEKNFPFPHAKPYLNGILFISFSNIGFHPS